MSAMKAAIHEGLMDDVVILHAEIIYLQCV